METPYVVHRVPKEDFSFFKKGPHMRKRLAAPLPSFRTTTVKGEVVRQPMPFEMSYPISQAMLEKAGLEGLLGMGMFEMRKRPLPHVFKEEQVRNLTELYSARAPLMFEVLQPHLKFGPVAFNKQSKMGWPVFDHPENRLDVIRAACHDTVNGSDLRESGVIAIGTRLQDEDVAKTREFYFCDSDMKTYLEKTDRRQYSEEFDGVPGKLVPARTRNIFNYPVQNYACQMFDNIVQNALFNFRAFHHNLYGDSVPQFPYATAFDVKHMERHTASLATARAKLIGGIYGDVKLWFDSLPFLTWADGFKDLVIVEVLRDKGFVLQFGSGRSEVACLQKEAMWVLMAEFLHRHRGIDYKAALELAAGAGDQQLYWLNSGDDNVIFSNSKDEIDSFLKFASDYLTIEVEDQVKFLGMVAVGTRWCQPSTSYPRKTYLPERPPFSVFRKMPFLGWMLRRESYSKYFDGGALQEIFALENDLLLRYGEYSWDTVLRAGRTELRTSQAPSLSDPRFLEGKSYLLNEEEKLATGDYVGFRTDEVRSFVTKLVPPQYQPKT